MRGRSLNAASAALVVVCALFATSSCHCEEEDAPLELDLVVNVVGRGRVDVYVPGPLRTATQEVPCSVEVGDAYYVRLEAIAAEGWRFVSWEGVDPTEVVSTGPSAVDFIIHGNRTITATFEQQSFTLVVAVDGPGKVTSLDPAVGVECGAGATACTTTLTRGETARLQATPDPNHGLLEWTWDGGRSEEDAIDVVADADRTVTATFRPLRTLSVEVVGSGAVAGLGISCPGTCVASVVEGRAGKLTATPTTGSTFVGWTGTFGSSASGTIEVAMGATDASVTATFETPFETATYDLDPFTEKLGNCVSAHVVRLRPYVTVGFPSDSTPVFTFTRQLDDVATTIEATGWNPATGRATGGAGGDCVDFAVACGSAPVTHVCYSFELDVTFTDAAHFGGWLVVHQDGPLACGPSLCLTRYEPIAGTMRSQAAKLRRWR